jgi:hypothetical protein
LRDVIHLVPDDQSPCWNTLRRKGFNNHRHGLRARPGGYHLVEHVVVDRLLGHRQRQPDIVLAGRVYALQVTAPPVAFTWPDNTIHRILDHRFGVTDLNGQPVPRITYALRKHEQVAQTFYLLPATAMIAASGATPFAAIPDGLRRRWRAARLRSVFVTSGCHNPANTLIAAALRTARGLTGRR